MNVLACRHLNIIFLLYLGMPLQSHASRLCPRPSFRQIVREVENAQLAITEAAGRTGYELGLLLYIWTPGKCQHAALSARTSEVEIAV